MKKQLVKKNFWNFEARNKGPEDYENGTFISINATDFSMLRKKIRTLNKAACFECWDAVLIWYHYGVPSKKEVRLFHARFENAHKLIFWETTKGVNHEISI